MNQQTKSQSRKRIALSPEPEDLELIERVRGRIPESRWVLDAAVRRAKEILAQQGREQANG